MLDTCIQEHCAFLVPAQTHAWVFHLAGWAVRMKTWLTNTDVYVSN